MRGWPQWPAPLGPTNERTRGRPTLANIIAFVACDAAQDELGGWAHHQRERLRGSLIGRWLGRANRWAAANKTEERQTNTGQPEQWAPARCGAPKLSDGSPPADSRAQTYALTKRPGTGTVRLRGAEPPEARPDNMSPLA